MLSLCAPLALLGASAAAANPLCNVMVKAVRELPNSPSGGYAPAVVPCPDTRPTVRLASGLSPEEASWLLQRRNVTVQPMIELLGRAAIPNFDATSFINSVASNLSALPNVGIAISGGGYRAMLNGAGFVAAADSRTPGATDQRGIGGLLQASTYLAGLSGGAWLVGSIYANNFSNVVTLRDGGGSPGSSVWQLNNSILKGPTESGRSLLNTTQYWGEVQDAVSSKQDAGFNISITDYWGRTLSYQLVNDVEGGPAYTFSSTADMDNFKQGQIPFPILVADERAPNTTVVSLNATVFEFNPFELGSWDPTVFGFVPMQFLGSNFSNGTVLKGGQCVEGFDQSGFVMGTSSSLFNQILVYNLSTVLDVPPFVINAIEGIAAALDQHNLDIANYQPNPFLGWRPGSNPSANEDQLVLVDGGEDLENIPLWPLIQQPRAVDVIFAVDSSADTTNNWPNGTALRATYDRSQSPISNSTVFPPVPDADTFINEGLNYRPSFFGCNVSNFTLGPGQSPPPLIVYVPNAPYTFQSNTSTFDIVYPDNERNDIIRNGYNAATQGNATLDSNWPVCVACAVLSRSLERTGTAVPSACNDCFSRYCWNGTLNTTMVISYEPQFMIGNETTVASSSALATGDFGGGRGAALSSFAVAALAMWLLL